MYINGYEVLITAPNEGLLYLPLVKSRVPVIWQGLSIKTGSDGEDYGCVMAGEVAMQGSQTGAISNDLYRQVMALLTQGPGSFSWKFGEAVKLISAQGDSLKKGLPINWASSKGALNAGKKGYEEWQAKTEGYFTKDGGTVPPEVEAILAQMQAQQDDLERLSSCVVQNIPTTGGGDAASLRLKTAFFACELTEAEIDKMVGLEGEMQDLERELSIVLRPNRVLLIGGANLIINGDDISEETQQIYNGIDKSKIFDIKALNLIQFIPDALVFPAILDEIQREYRLGQKVILYGYSMGGVGVLRMSRSLNERNIPVSLLITVDAAYSIASDGIDRTVPNNVMRNLNYYQTNLAPPLYSIGGPNSGLNVSNVDQSEIIYKGNKMNHSEIDEYNIQTVISLINNEIR